MVSMLHVFNNYLNLNAMDVSNETVGVSCLAM